MGPSITEKWGKPIDHTVEDLVRNELWKVVAGPPINLFTDEGKRQILSEFEWTALARMTPKEARAARVQFIRNHSGYNDRQMAAALKAAGLYSPETGLSQIRKTLPALISEAGTSRAI